MKLLLAGAPERKKLDALQAKIAPLEAEAKGIGKQPPSEKEREAAVRNSATRLLERYSCGLDEIGSDAAHVLPTVPALRVAAFVIRRLGVDAVVSGEMQDMRDRGARFGMPREQREKRLAEIKAELERLGIDEERAILKLEAQGFSVIRRATIDGALVVRVWAQDLVQGAAA